MKPKVFYTKKNTDLFIYAILVLLLAFYAIYIKGTCEGIGCIAMVIPIIGVMGISVIEFFINIWIYSKKYHFNIQRKIVFVISGIIAVFSLILFLPSLIN